MAIRGILFNVLTVWSATAVSATLCGRATDHASESACLTEAVEGLNARIRAAEGLQRQRIAHWDEDPSYRAKAIELFDEAMDSFVRFRDAQCAFEASAAAGGNGAGDLLLGCQAALDEAHLKSIQSQAAWFMPKS